MKHNESSTMVPDDLDQSRAQNPCGPKAKIIVVGSLNIDLIATVESLPLPGQTIAASSLVRRFGGKGANQAFAAACQEADVQILGCLGDDLGGRDYLVYLADVGIDTEGVIIEPRLPTGTAMISVDSMGENCIVYNAGANGSLTASHVRLHRRCIASAEALLLEGEIPLAAILESIRIANSAGVPVYFNSSPIHPDFPWGKVRVDVLVVNEGEAREIFGACAIADAELASWRQKLTEYAVQSLVITRGAKSTIYLTPESFGKVPVLRLDPIDTVGAGDAFVGTLAVRLAEGESLAAAVAAGNCAGGLTTLKSGAQTAIPTRHATNQALQLLPAF
jgi:ribokinase